MKLEDSNEMPFGEHKGVEMANVPEGWLLWFWGENSHQFKTEPGKLSESARAVMEYIIEHLDERKL